MPRTILALLCFSVAATGCASRTMQFAELGKVVKPGDRITVVGKNEEMTTGRIARLPEMSGDSLVVDTAPTLRMFAESDIAKIQKRQWVPLQGLGKGAVTAAILCLFFCSDAPAFAWGAAGGGVIGLVWGFTKPWVGVYQYATTDVMAPALALAEVRPGTPSIVSADVRWGFKALRRAGTDDLELESSSIQFGSIEWDFSYERVLLRPSAEHDYAAQHLAFSLDDLHGVTCEERLGEPSWYSVDKRTAESLAARHVWCRFDYGKSTNAHQSVFVRIGPPVGATNTAEERATRVITLMRTLLGDKLTHP